MHPKRSYRQKIARSGTTARIEALMLGLTFFELALLRLFEYDGVYFCRWGGDSNEERLRPVPWT